ncbi:methyltransferase domain-containing protein [Pseudonocardiaceae bacterium YIM PH 21723]|nr:methyltransferase domain-containing protein [Pseudonocardiaceae bacterium YIM PH 21723]
MTENQLDADQILRLGTAYCDSRALLSAVELGVFTALGAGALDAGTLRDRLGLHPRGARDFFDALVSLGVLTRVDGSYANTPVTARILDRGSPDYQGGFLEHNGKRSFHNWAGLTDSLRTGLPQHGTGNMYDAYYSDPEVVRQFQRAMTDWTRPSAEAIGRDYPWDRVDSVADIGCAEGALLVRLLKQHPHLRCVGMDLPAAGPQFAEYAGEHAEFVGGDFFTDELPSAQVLVFGHVLHNWDVDTRRMLLAKAYRALPPGGEVILWDVLLDDDRRANTYGLLMSLNMFLKSGGGSEYTGADAREWLTDAGFQDVRVQPLAEVEAMVIATKGGAR